MTPLEPGAGMGRVEGPVTEARPVIDAQKALIKAIWACITDASAMNVVMSGGEVNAAIRQFRAAIEAAARAEVIAEIRAGVEGLQGWKAGTLPGIQDCVPRAAVLALLPPTEPKT